MQGRQVLAVCDREIAGRELRQGKVSFAVSERFYKEKSVGEKELRQLLHMFDNINIVGNRAVAIAMEEKLVQPESVMEIQGVKHVQIFKV